MKQFSERLESIKKYLDYNQEQMANLIKVSRNTYQRYESEKTYPSVKELLILEPYLVQMGKDFNWLITGTELPCSSVTWNARDGGDRSDEYIWKRIHVLEMRIESLKADIKKKDGEILNLEKRLNQRDRSEGMKGKLKDPKGESEGITGDENEKDEK